MTKSPEIAATVLRQLGGTSRLAVMIGAKNFLDLGAGASFKFARGKRRGPNYVKIRLNGLDLYDVEFGAVRGYTYKVCGEFSNVCVSQLHELFEGETGLYLSL